jgi:hypothetical protein
MPISFDGLKASLNFCSVKKAFIEHTPFFRVANTKRLPAAPSGLAASLTSAKVKGCTLGVDWHFSVHAQYLLLRRGASTEGPPASKHTASQGHALMVMVMAMAVVVLMVVTPMHNDCLCPPMHASTSTS